MPSRKRSNTYWSTNTFAPSVAICIARIICHRLSAAICIGRPICLCSSGTICIDRSICHRGRAAIYMYWSTNMSSTSGSNMHWLHQYATKFNMIYYTYWNSYRIVQGMKKRHKGQQATSWWHPAAFVYHGSESRQKFNSSVVTQLQVDRYAFERSHKDET